MHIAHASTHGSLSDSSLHGQEYVGEAAGRTMEKSARLHAELRLDIHAFRFDFDISYHNRDSLKNYPS